jgi:hypothetical protein
MLIDNFNMKLDLIGKQENKFKRMIIIFKKISNI